LYCDKTSMHVAGEKILMILPFRERDGETEL